MMKETADVPGVCGLRQGWLIRGLLVTLRIKVFAIHNVYLFLRALERIRRWFTSGTQHKPNHILNTQYPSLFCLLHQSWIFTSGLLFIQYIII